MKVIQLLPTISFGDAVGNDTIAIKQMLLDLGYDAQIYAENIDGRLPKDTAKPVSEMPELTADDVLIYHGSTGTALNELLPSLGCRKIMIYHNITPAQYFLPYSASAANLTQQGIDQMKQLADVFDYCIADSEYNKQELIQMGYTCPIDVCPILIQFPDYEKAPSKKVINIYQNDGYTNLLFVGRIAPNKKQEDVILAFYVYQKLYNTKSRLFLVGNASGMELYENRLHDYVNVLGIGDKVIFTGHIKFDEILAYYHLADVFLCMSEHEGFCVPLVEAMHFDKPIVARDTSAIAYTLGGSGVLLEGKDPLIAAQEIRQLLENEDLKERILEGQRKRLQDFRTETVQNRLRQCLEKFI